MTVTVILTGCSVERCCNIMSRYYRVSARFCAVGVRPMWYTWQRYAECEYFDPLIPLSVCNSFIR